MIHRRKPLQRKTALKRSTKPLKRSTKPLRARRSAPRRGPADIPPDQWRNPRYLAFLRECGVCVACKLEGYVGSTGRAGHCDPCHGPPNGKSQKGPDAGAIPMCRQHHAIQTSRSWPVFEELYEFSRKQEAAVWWTAFMIWKEAQ